VEKKSECPDQATECEGRREVVMCSILYINCHVNFSLKYNCTSRLVELLRPAV
jgi:hypothetical protein